MQQVRREFAADAMLAEDRTALSRPPAPSTSRPKLKPVAPVAPIGRDRALAVSRGKLPVPVRRRGGILVTLGNLWVLHKKLALRALALMLAAALVMAAYVARDELTAGAVIVGNLVTGQVAEAGFGITRIEITGQALTRERDVARALEIDGATTSLSFDAEAARQRVEEIPSVETATIRKIYPDSLIVTITEKVPVARWRIDGATMLIDARGSPIAPAGFENSDLMLVIGEGAGDDAVAMITLMSRYPDLTADLAALSRIADRRWDLIYYSGLRVQLPETGVVAALNRLNQYNGQHQILARDIELIDMRVPQYVAVRPTVRDDT